MKTFTLILFLFISLTGLSQTFPSQNFCGTDNVTEELYQQDTALRNQAMRNYIRILNREKDPKFRFIDIDNRVIPVVFHIIHQCGSEYIEDSQITNALDDVNNDFSAVNSEIKNNLSILKDTFDLNPANIGLKFQLATIDPHGNATTGITRTEHYTTFNGAFFEYDIKSLMNWSRNQYLNIWVVSTTGGSAFAHFPSTTNERPLLDGIVISHNYLGTSGTSEYKFHGRSHTLTHEIGHWLGLYHTWGKTNYPGYNSNCIIDTTSFYFDDDVCDTPNTIGDAKIVYPNDSIVDGIMVYPGVDSIYGNNNNSLEKFDLPNTCNNSFCSDTVDFDNIFNFMDYGCEILFTEGQRTRMATFLNDSIAQRNEIGHTLNNTKSFIRLNCEDCEAITFDGYFFQENENNDGTFKDPGIEISLSSGTFNFETCYSDQLNISYFHAFNLPQGLRLQLERNAVHHNKATLRIIGTALNHSSENNINDLKITFLQNAFTTNLKHFYNTSINNLKIKYIDEYKSEYKSFDKSTNVQNCVINTVNNYGEFSFERIGVLAVQYYEDILFYDLDNLVESGFYLVTESDMTIEAICINNTSSTNKIATLPYNYSIESELNPNLTYKKMTRSPYFGDGLLITSADEHFPNDTTLYIGIKTTNNCTQEHGLGWLKLHVTDNGNKICAIDGVMNYDPSNKELIIQNPECIPTILHPSYLHISSVLITNVASLGTINTFTSLINSQSGTNNLGYSDFSDLSLFPNKKFIFNKDENYYLKLIQGNPSSTTYDAFWHIWIDFNNDMFFDSNEKVFFQYNSNSVISGSNNTPYFKLPTNATTGTHKMRIGITMHNYSEGQISLNPCKEIAYGEFEDYTIFIQDDCADYFNFTQTFPIDSLSVSKRIDCYSNSKVQSGQNVLLTAGEEINFIDNFETLEGATFEAKIEQCDSDTSVANKNSESKAAITSTEKSNIKINIYPNPTQDSFQIDFSINKNSYLNISILNSNGKEIKKLLREEYEEGHHSIISSLNSLNDGVYFIKIQANSKEQFVHKIVKIR